MKRFSFPLDALLEIKKRREEAVKLALAKKNREIFNAQNEFALLHNKLQELQKEQKEKRKNVKDVFSLKYSVSFRNKLKLDMLKKDRDIEKLKRQSEDIQHELVKATKEKKAIELVREKRYSEWLKQNKLHEQVFIDDLSQQGYIRRIKAEKSLSAA